MKKTNNKGFSLVELIVVIAIMAVLVGVLAPQFLKFVERGRKSTDVQNVNSIKTAIETYAADPSITVAADKVSDCTIDLTTEIKDTTSISANGVKKALQDAKIDKYGLKSSQWGTGVKLNVEVDEKGSVIVTTTGETTVDGVAQNIIKGIYK